MWSTVVSAYTHTRRHTHADTHVRTAEALACGCASCCLVSLHLTLTTPISSLDTKRRVNAFSRKVSTRNITWDQRNKRRHRQPLRDRAVSARCCSSVSVYLEQHVIRRQPGRVLQNILRAHRGLSPGTPTESWSDKMAAAFYKVKSSWRQTEKTVLFYFKTILLLLLLPDNRVTAVLPLPYTLNGATLRADVTERSGCPAWSR